MKNTGVLLCRKDKDQQYKQLFDVELLTNYSEGFGDDLVFEITDEFVLPRSQIIGEKNIEFLFLQDTEENLRFGMISFESNKYKAIAINSVDFEISLQLMIKLKEKPTFLGYIKIYDLVIDPTARQHILKRSKEGSDNVPV